MTDQSNDTKDKIMEVARVLFATHGFAGTSVREIARVAEVNVASVNYHFSTKEKLFHEILLRGYSDCATDIQALAEKHPSVENLLVEIFRYFQTKSHDLISQFKMMMSEGEKVVPQGEDVGPPGGKALVHLLRLEAGVHISEENLHWALKVLFGHVVHMSIMYNCCFKSAEVPFSSVKDVEDGTRRLARMVLRELKNPT